MGRRKAIEVPREGGKVLQGWIKEKFGLWVPDTCICKKGHQPPLDYVEHALMDRGDVVVWAPREGGKTTLGALVTVLDLISKPGCQVRILGGSLQQSMRMWEQMLPLLDRVKGEIDGRPMAEVVRLKNGSRAAVLTQSETSVRGQRVQKMRCDEVEDFDEKVWTAAQMTTRSLPLADGRVVTGTVEALSTRHKPSGLMTKVIDDSVMSGRRVFKWCLIDVLEKCTRDCDEKCPLWKDCQGNAREGTGFVSIDDAIRRKARVEKDTWMAEAMCEGVDRRYAVFHPFSRTRHVKEEDWWYGMPGRDVRRTLAVDFGFTGMFVCLWVLSDDEGRVYVMDEFTVSGQTLERNIAEMRRRKGGWNEVSCDPAGNHHNSHTGMTDVNVLSMHGFLVRHRPTKILDGVEQVNSALDPADESEPKLRISPKCSRLISSMMGYHFDEKGRPVKDGNDHCCDALRYFYVNRAVGSGASVVV